MGDTAQVEILRQGPEETLRRGQLIHVTETQKAGGDGAEEADRSWKGHGSSARASLLHLFLGTAGPGCGLGSIAVVDMALSRV